MSSNILRAVYDSEDRRNKPVTKEIQRISIERQRWSESQTERLCGKEQKSTNYINCVRDFSGVLTDGFGVEVERFSIVLLDIVGITLFFEAFSFPTDS